MLLSNAFKGWNDWWRFPLGVMIIFSFYFIGQLPLYGVIWWKFASNSELGGEALKQFEKSMDFEMLGLHKNIGFLLLILMFAFAFLGLYLTVKYLHSKLLINLITTKNTVNTQKIFFGFGLWLVLSICVEAVNYYFNQDSYAFTWNPAGFFPLLIIALFFLPVQTTFEELFFRGYIMQAIAFFTQNKWAAIGLSSILFGLVHGTNPEVAKYGFWTMQVYYISAGLFLAIITILDDSLELALGVHAATNFFGAALFSYEGSVIRTDSLFISNEVNPISMIAGFLAASVSFILICGKIYKWPGIHTLFEKVTISDNKTDIISASD